MQLELVPKNKRFEKKSRQNLTKTAGAGIGAASRGRDFENEFAGAGEKRKSRLRSEQGVSINLSDRTHFLTRIKFNLHTLDILLIK